VTLFNRFGHQGLGAPDQRDVGLDRRNILAGLLGVGLGPLLNKRAVASPERRPLIILDPGHGGHDPGAIGVTGLYEKHIALSTAHALKAALIQNGRYRVMLTRDDDQFIPLDQRRTIADMHAASLFVSLHADALHDRTVRGASVYTLSSQASDRQSDELAQRENSVDPAAMEEYKNYSPDVANILASLAKRETNYFSGRLQSNLVDTLSDDIRMLHNPARHADFVVLRSFDTPSVLVEMGFMSNEADEHLLQSDNHRARVVTAIHTGIDSYMSRLIEHAKEG
jgi:N-acetylmuramoyl-L-alanine amidase